MAKTLLTPKDLADAVGVSESSMRRWLDTGKIRMTRTAGGHRRIELAEALRFVGEIANHTCQHTCEEERFFEALSAGDRMLARGLAVSWHVAGRSLAGIFDG